MRRHITRYISHHVERLMASGLYLQIIFKLSRIVYLSGTGHYGALIRCRFIERFNEYKTYNEWITF